MKDYLVECLSEILADFDVKLSGDQLDQVAEDLDHGIACYNDMVSDSIPYWNPAEDKVKELSKKMESMHEDSVVVYYRSKLEDSSREIKRLRLLIQDLQQNSRG